MQSVSCNALNFGSPNNNYKFNGGDEWEESLNLYSTFFRGYDQQIGRFRGVDVMSEQTAGISNYQFSFNNPISFNDPLGNAAGSLTQDDLERMWSSANGGHWDADNGTKLFADQDEALQAFVDAYGGSGSGFGRMDDRVIAALVKANVMLGKSAREKVKEYKSYYRNAVEAITSAYPGFYDISTFQRTPLDVWDRSVNETQIFEAKTFSMYISIPLLEDFAYNQEPSFNFGELVASIYHEYIHVYTEIIGGGERGNFKGLFGFPFLNYNRSTEEEQEFYAYYMSHQCNGLPSMTRQGLVNDYRQGMSYFQEMPKDKQSDPIYLSWYLQMAFLNR